jgi:hypothetical protein
MCIRKKTLAPAELWKIYQLLPLDSQSGIANIMFPMLWGSIEKQPGNEAMFAEIETLILQELQNG